MEESGAVPGGALDTRPAPKVREALAYGVAPGSVEGTESAGHAHAALRAITASPVVIDGHNSIGEFGAGVGGAGGKVTHSGSVFESSAAALPGLNIGGRCCVGGL